MLVKQIIESKVDFDIKDWLREMSKTPLTFQSSKHESKVYSFEYNYCVYESSYTTVSLHKTIKGAYKAMRNFLEENYNEWREEGILYGKQRFKFGENEDWRVRSIDLKE